MSDMSWTHDLSLTSNQNYLLLNVYACLPYAGLLLVMQEVEHSFENLIFHLTFKLILLKDGTIKKNNRQKNTISVIFCLTYHRMVAILYHVFIIRCGASFLANFLLLSFTTNWFSFTF